LLTGTDESCSLNKFIMSVWPLLAGQNSTIIPYVCLRDFGLDSYLLAFSRLVKLDGFLSTLQQNVQTLPLLRPLPTFSIAWHEDTHGLTINATLKTPDNKPLPQEGIHLYYQAIGSSDSREVDYNVTNSDGVVTYTVRNAGNYELISATDRAL